MQDDKENLWGKLEELGFERGWGKDVPRIKETMNMLLDILEVSFICSGSLKADVTHSDQRPILANRIESR